MASISGCGAVSRLFQMRGTWLCAAAGLAIVLSGIALPAQDAQGPPDFPIPTLHVYTNLLQVPTLVLGPNREPLGKPIAESRFSISIDDGPLFRATHVRQQGDDPISLSIVLDASGDSESLMPKMADAIANLAPLWLHPKDHVSIYVLDCSLIRSLNDVAADQKKLKLGVDAALQPWATRKQTKHMKSCKQSIHLWDSLGYVTLEMENLPGRRVMLVVSDGHDQGSKHTWNAVRSAAQGDGVAIFGMSEVPGYARDAGHSVLTSGLEDPFHSLCELTGGIVTPATTMSVMESLKTFTKTVRERYIVEFPRPSNATSGEHGMEVKIAKGWAYFVRSAGISVPLPDPKVVADPTTVSSGPKEAPEQGKRQILPKPQ
jgi:hypothetical protein